MARVIIENDELIINMQGVIKFLTLRSALSIPLSSVQEATTYLNWKDAPKILKIRIGVNISNTYFGGTFWQDGDKVFYDLRNQENSVVIILKDEDFKHIIFGVENPSETVEVIENAIKRKLLRENLKVRI